MRTSPPSRDEMNEDSPLRLSVAAKLAFPDGSMSASGLRREAARGRLVIERIAGKDFTTLANIERMRELCRVATRVPDCGSGSATAEQHSGSSSITACEFRTGASANDLSAAEDLATYLANKRRPNFGHGHPAQILIADVLADYGEFHAPSTKSSDLIGGAINKLVDYFEDRTADAVISTACRDYVRWRTLQVNARAKRNGKSIKPSTARRELVVLGAALRWCWKEGKIDRLRFGGPACAIEPARTSLNSQRIAALLAGALGLGSSWQTPPLEDQSPSGKVHPHWALHGHAPRRNSSPGMETECGRGLD